MKIVIVSGGFDPLHSGHIDYMKDAASLGEKLIIALNSDQWLENKKGKYFMPFIERQKIIKHLEFVHDVIDFEDDELGSCILGLEKIKKLYPRDEIIFCNGGDRTNENIPELIVDGINFKFGVGGETKVNSSSWILKKWKYENEERVWGNFYNLFEDESVKVKELVVNSGKGMSFQRHMKRNEIWFISKGSCKVHFSKDNPDNYEEIILKEEDVFYVKKLQWHQIINHTKEPCHIIELQYGEAMIEEDIERLRFFDE